MNTIRAIIESQSLIDNRYKILQLAGEGYFSYVFRGLDTVNNIDVALKFLKKADNPYDGFRFEREAEALSALSHRHIIKLVQGKTPFTIDYLGHVVSISSFYVMEWLDQNFRDFIIYCQEPQQILKLFRQVCLATNYLHREGYCHRDLKPENILVHRRRHAYISDFGSIKMLQRLGFLHPEQYKGPAGDFRYTSPELLCGLNDDERNFISGDKFALGAILFEAFTKEVFSSKFQNYHRLCTGYFTQLMYSRPYLERERAYEEIIAQVLREENIPRIYDFSSFVPGPIKQELNLLCQKLVQPDCRKRTIDFDEIFRRIDNCLSLLKK